jgi:hypothetical protein
MPILAAFYRPLLQASRLNCDICIKSKPKSTGYCFAFFFHKLFSMTELKTDHQEDAWTTVLNFSKEKTQQDAIRKVIDLLDAERTVGAYETGWRVVGEEDSFPIQKWKLWRSLSSNITENSVERGYKKKRPQVGALSRGRHGAYVSSGPY